MKHKTRFKIFKAVYDFEKCRNTSKKLLIEVPNRLQVRQYLAKIPERHKKISPNEVQYYYSEQF